MCNLASLFSDNTLTVNYYVGPRRLSCSSLQMSHESLSGGNLEHIETSKIELFPKILKGF